MPGKTRVSLHSEAKLRDSLKSSADWAQNMYICATQLKMCTYAGRVRASLALDAGERTRRPCYNVLTSFTNNTGAILFDVYPLDKIQHGYEDKKFELSPCTVEYSPDPQSRQLTEFGAPATIFDSLAPQIKVLLFRS